MSLNKEMFTSADRPIKVKIKPLSFIIKQIHGEVDEVVRTKDVNPYNDSPYTMLETKHHLFSSDCYEFCNAALLFKDYFNNFLSLEGFAEHYGLTLGAAKQLIEQGKAEHEAECQD